MSISSARARAAEAASAKLQHFYFDSRYGARRGEPGISDFTFGNPHELPLAGITTAIRSAAIARNKDWFAYKTNEPEACAFLADAMTRELGLAFEPTDIALTAGAFGAIAVAFRLLLDAGDEAVISEPSWFCYEPTLRLADAVPRKVRLAGARFDLDLAAIDAAIGPRTRLVIVNTPHNPTGRIYDRAALEALGEMLDRASKRIGRRVFLLSDEPYRRLRFDRRSFVSPAAVYPWTLISYSYAKVLLTPGQRLGYLALSPLMPRADRDALAALLFPVQMAIGWSFPNAVMQYSLPALEKLSIDIEALARRRDLLTAALKTGGAGVLAPEGTFYLWGHWPSGDPESYWHRLADRDVFVMPGSVMDAPDHFRISLTASDDMVERSLPAFRALSN